MANINTSRSVYGREEPKGTIEPVHSDGPPHVVNTSDILEPPQMVYTDEAPEIIHVLPGGGWFAEFEDGHRERLVFWAVVGSGEAHGVTINEKGAIDVEEDVSRRDGFRKYHYGND